MPKSSVTSAAFNRVTRLPVVVPVTSGGNFARTAGFAVSLDGAGIRTTGFVRCDQPRTIDMKARGGKRLERVPETIMSEVLGRLSTILTLTWGGGTTIRKREILYILRKGMYGSKSNDYRTVRSFRTAFTFSGYAMGQLMFSLYAETMHDLLLKLSRFPCYSP